MVKTLILAEHSHGTLHPATARAVAAARQLGQDVRILVAGESSETAAQAAARLGPALHADAPHYRDALAEEIAPLIAQLAAEYTHIVAPATTTGKDILPRAAALLGVGMISDVVRILSPDTFVRPIYAGNALETVKSGEKITVLTVRPTAFEAAAEAPGGGVKKVNPLPSKNISCNVSRETFSAGRPELVSARIIISGGRGLGSAENFQKLEALADRLGAAVGASRAAVDAGFAPNDLQVGQTGKVVAPELYLAIGISGAIQHVAGMKESKVVVAVNKDENAPIFDIADYGLVADWETVLPELERLL